MKVKENNMSDVAPGLETIGFRIDELPEEIHKTLNVTSSEDLKQKVSDVEIFGNGDLFKLVAKASSKSQKWMKSTKCLNLPTGALIQVSTQNCENVAEALQFIPNVNYNFDKSAFEIIGFDNEVEKEKESDS